MQAEYKTSLTLFSSYFDKNDRLSVKSILNIFQDVAANHAEILNIGYEKMLSKNLFWVLSRIKFDIIVSPVPNQKVFVKTWPHQKGKIDFDRDMLIVDENENVLVKATSKWCVIDCKTRQLARTDGIDYAGEILQDKNYEEKFNKITLPNTQYEKMFDYQVMFSDLDHNGHMNNTNYANLVTNCVENKKISHFEINFLNECVFNDIINVYKLWENNEEYVFGKVNDKIVFVTKSF